MKINCVVTDKNQEVYMVKNISSNKVEVQSLVSGDITTKDKNELTENDNQDILIKL